MRNLYLLLLLPSLLLGGDFRLLRKRIFHHALSEDGKVLVYRRDEGPLDVVDAVSGEIRSQLNTEGNAPALSHDGRLLALNMIGSVRLLTLPEGKFHRKLQLDANSMAFSPDGRWLASLRFDTLTVTDLRTGRKVKSAHVKDNVDTLVWTPSNQLVVAVSYTYRAPASICAMAFPGGRLQWTAPLDERDRIHCLAVSPDGTRIAAGGRDGVIQLFEGTAGRKLAAVQAHADQVRALAFAESGELLSLGPDMLTLWEGTLVPRLRLQAPPWGPLVDGAILRLQGDDLLYVSQHPEDAWEARRSPWRPWLAQLPPALPEPRRLWEGRPLMWLPSGMMLVEAPGALLGYGSDLKERWRLPLEEESLHTLPKALGPDIVMIRRLSGAYEDSLHWLDAASGRWIATEPLDETNLHWTPRGLLLRRGNRLALQTSRTSKQWEIEAGGLGRLRPLAACDPWMLFEHRQEEPELRLDLRWLDLRSGAWGAIQPVARGFDRPLKAPCGFERTEDALALLEGALIVRGPEGLRCVEAGGAIAWRLPLDPSTRAEVMVRNNSQRGVLALDDGRWGWLDLHSGWLIGALQAREDARPFCLDADGSLLLEQPFPLFRRLYQAGPGAPLLPEASRPSQPQRPRPGEEAPWSFEGPEGQQILVDPPHYGDAPARRAMIQREGQPPDFFLVGPIDIPVVEPGARRLLFARQGGVWLQELVSR